VARETSPTDSTTILARFAFDHRSDDSTCPAEIGGPRAFFGASMQRCDFPSDFNTISDLGGGTGPAPNDLNAILDLGGDTGPAGGVYGDGTPDSIKTTPPATPSKPIRCNPICYGFFSPQNSPATTPARFPTCLALTLPRRKVRREPSEGPGLHDLLKDAIDQGSVVLAGC
jgi:hypothetical protein